MVAWFLLLSSQCREPGYLFKQYVYTVSCLFLAVVSNITKHSYLYVCLDLVMHTQLCKPVQVMYCVLTVLMVLMPLLSVHCMCTMKTHSNHLLVHGLSTNM